MAYNKESARARIARVEPGEVRLSPDPVTGQPVLHDGTGDGVTGSVTLVPSTTEPDAYSEVIVNLGLKDEDSK